jgi:hypothetical protein
LSCSVTTLVFVVSVFASFISLVICRAVAQLECSV